MTTKVSKQEVVGVTKLAATVSEALEELSDVMQERIHEFLGIVSLALVATVIRAVLPAPQVPTVPVHLNANKQTKTTGSMLAALAERTLMRGGVYAVIGNPGNRQWWLRGGHFRSALGGLIGAIPLRGVMFIGDITLGATAGMFSGLVGVLMIERVPNEARGEFLELKTQTTPQHHL
ncbi:hypothetical protein [Brevibacterium aurantiacum]|uniref:Uncharacterized protein n=1 Tax=Brevibacterium aurantiacum TaxID=273384 RepID=A0A556CBU6_BREAU|nr:hypothetical protein [Brevibacterium aurantiacum]TSI14909.1 hypothetical protein FO013_12745 [Brevibacterium aurantiacum]